MKLNDVSFFGWNTEHVEYWMAKVVYKSGPFMDVDDGIQTNYNRETDAPSDRVLRMRTRNQTQKIQSQRGFNKVGNLEL